DEKTPDDQPWLTGRVPAAPSAFKPEDGFLRWPVPPGRESYATIDGRHLHRLVVEQTAISRRYRDQGHPQFWGRIIGTSADEESAQWLIGKFKTIGLADVHLQPLELTPQWMPEAWNIAASTGNKTRALSSAQPAYLTPGTGPDGVELEAVYAGTGS